MDFRLELVLLPVTDVDRAKDFYEKLGFHLDVDHQSGDEFRVVQFTPPGSGCSVAFGIGISQAAPGSVEGLHLVVNDIEAARQVLVTAGADPAHADYNSFAEFADPDGNQWVLQEVPGRG